MLVPSYQLQSAFYFISVTSCNAFVLVQGPRAFLIVIGDDQSVQRDNKRYVENPFK